MTDALLMRRCLDLAKLGGGAVNPNPMVGSLLIHDHQIIGEGYHQKYGQAHAEVHCFNNVKQKNINIVKDAELFVTLEPCCITGNTPACSDLILKKQVTSVKVSAIDLTPGVNGSSIDILRKNGIKVTTNILAEAGQKMVAIRNTFVTQQRPYIILKYAQSMDHFMGKRDRQIWLTNAVSKRLTHKWRSQNSAILVGTNTALIDNPRLDNRLFYGPSPLRIVLDRHHKIPAHFHLKNDQQPTLIVCEKGTELPNTNQTTYLGLDWSSAILPALNQYLYEHKISSLMVEGGAQTLASFISANLWDEARVFTAPVRLEAGVPAPTLSGTLTEEVQIGADILRRYVPG